MPLTPKVEICNKCQFMKTNISGFEHGKFGAMLPAEYDSRKWCEKSSKDINNDGSFGFSISAYLKDEYFHMPQDCPYILEHTVV